MGNQPPRVIRNAEKPVFWTDNAHVVVITHKPKTVVLVPGRLENELIDYTSIPRGTAHPFNNYCKECNSNVDIMWVKIIEHKKEYSSQPFRNVAWATLCIHCTRHRVKWMNSAHFKGLQNTKINTN